MLNTIKSHKDNILRSGLLLDSLFLAAAITVLTLLVRHDQMLGDFSITFLAIILEALPFMLVGSLAGGLIEVFMPDGLFDRLLKGKKYWAIFVGAGLGLIFPVCECAIIPVVRRLLGKGVPFSAAIAFLLGGPIVNPVVAASTATAYGFDWTMAGARLGFGYLIAVTVAFLMGSFFPDKKALKIIPLPMIMLNDAIKTKTSHKVSFFHVVRHAGDDFFEVGKFLVIGSFIAALLRTTIPVSVFETLSAGPFTAIAVMMTAAILLNLCSEADAFIAAGFRNILPESSQLAFMVLGPMLDIKLLLMYLPVFKKKAIITLALLTTTATGLAMWFYEISGVIQP
ncbi:MAG: permease [Desulfobulbaceae bacterium]|nr:permease [Desulfobulbaceae bacterium]